MANQVVASGNFLVPNATFFAELVLFLILLAIIWKFIVPPVQKTLQERQEIVDGQVEQAEETKAKLAEAEADYQGALNEARSQAAQIRENARAEAARTTDQLRTQAQEESARIVERGSQQLEGQRASIVAELRGEIGTLAVELSEKVVGQRLGDDSRVRATVDSYLADLGRANSSGDLGSAV